MTMNATISPNRTDILSALRSFLLAVLPDGTDVILAIENRVPEPTGPNFAIMSPIRFQRLSTNVDGNADVLFSGTIAPAPASFTGAIAPAPANPSLPASGIMTVSAVASGTLLVGGALSGTKVAAGTTITRQISGAPGGAGIYGVSISQATPGTTIAQACGLMTVTSVVRGSVLVGAAVFGVDVTAGTRITARGTGAGGTGTYAVNLSQAVTSQLMSSGSKSMTQSSKVTVQIDFHSIDGSSADMAQTVSTTFRDAMAVQFFAGLDYPLNQASPFYADDPRLMPFLNENSQYERRWVVEAELQANQIVASPQQFFDVVDLEVISVDAVYPPA